MAAFLRIGNAIFNADDVLSVIRDPDTSKAVVKYRAPSGMANCSHEATVTIDASADDWRSITAQVSSGTALSSQK